MNKKIVLIAIGIFLLFSFFLLRPVVSLALTARSIPEKIKPIKAALGSQDFEFIVFELEYLKGDLATMDKDADALQMYRILPYFGSYFSDLKILTSSSIDMVDTAIGLFSSIEESVPEFNFGGFGSLESASEVPAGNSISDVTSVLANELPNYKERLVNIGKRLNSIETGKYPESVGGIKLKAYMENMKDLSATLVTSFDDVVSFIQFVPELAGETEIKNYLIFLQNNENLRASGGSLTFYAVFTANKGNIKITKSGDTAFLNNGVLAYDAAPGFMVQRTNDPTLYLRDAGYQADFKASAQNIANLWSQVAGNTKIDGVIVVDSKFISGLVTVLGNIVVSDDEVYTTDNVEDKLSQFSKASGSHSEVDLQSKSSVTQLMYAILNRAFSTSLEKRAAMFKFVLKAANEKHLLVYFDNAAIQRIAENYSVAGRLTTKKGDYLFISTTNMSENVDDSLINQSVKLNVSKTDALFTNSLEIKYANSNAVNDATSNVYTNHVRVYVPKGAILLENSGIEGLSQGEEFDKTYFAGYISVDPKSDATAALKYTLPADAISERYQLFVQKQPGLDLVPYALKVDDFSSVFELATDQNVQVDL